MCLIVRKLQSQQGGGGGKDEVEQDKNNTSDQGESMNVGRGEEEINREAEPEEEREEMGGERRNVDVIQEHKRCNWFSTFQR